MSAFTFPQPGERINSSALVVPEHTLAALLALAEVGKSHLTTTDENFSTPQCDDALHHVRRLLSEKFYRSALANANQMERDLANEYPF